MAFAKCKHVGCYNAADCTHGYCQRHCTTGGHSCGDYSRRRMPRGIGPYMGIEIEVEFANDQDYRSGIAYADNGRRGIATYDGSLGYLGVEYKLLVLQEKAIKRSCTLLRELHFRRAKVSRQCGLHVHLDMRHTPKTRQLEALRWLFHTQEVWYRCAPPSRRNNHYIRQLALYMGAIDNYGEHYTWAHLSPYRTMEIRLHSATINCFKMQGWLACMSWLADHIRDVTYQFPGMNTPAIPGTFYASGYEMVSGLHPQDSFDEFWRTAPTIAREYITTRLANNGRIRDTSFQPREEEDDPNV